MRERQGERGGEGVRENTKAYRKMGKGEKSKREDRKWE